MQSKLGADMNLINSKKEIPIYSHTQFKEIVLSPRDIDLEIK